MTHPSWLKTLPTFIPNLGILVRSILIDVLVNDHAGPDPVEERLGYDVEVFGGQESEKGGTVVAHSTKGVFQYSPPEDLLGEDNFQYRLVDGEFSIVGNVKVYTNRQVLQNGLALLLWDFLSRP